MGLLGGDKLKNSIKMVQKSIIEVDNLLNKRDVRWWRPLANVRKIAIEVHNLLNKRYVIWWRPLANVPKMHSRG